MKTSITNFIISTNASVFSNVTEVVGKEAVNIVDPDSRRVYATATNLDIEIDGIGDLTSQVLALFNVTFYTGDTLVVKLYDSSNVLQETQTFNFGDERGFELDALYFEPATTSTIDKIEITTTGASAEKSIGFIWLGNYTDFGCSEEIQPASISNEKTQISRTNTPQMDSSYKYREYNITTAKNVDFDTLQANIEAIQLDGYGNARPFLLTEVPFNNLIFYGILDSPQIKYDIFDIQDSANISDITKRMAQTTLGIREVA